MARRSRPGRRIAPPRSRAADRNLPLLQPPEEFSRAYLDEVAEIAEAIPVVEVERLAEAIAAVRERGGRLFVVGVGGGAANASHAVGDLRRMCEIEAYAPSDNVGELTARTNDEGWETAFEPWLRTSRIGERDGLLVLSVGGGSRAHGVSVNLARAVELARDAGASVLAIVGRSDGAAAKAADAAIIVPAPPERLTAHVESFQSVICHLLACHPALARAPMRWESIEEAG